VCLRGWAKAEQEEEERTLFDLAPRKKRTHNALLSRVPVQQQHVCEQTAEEAEGHRSNNKHTTTAQKKKTDSVSARGVDKLMNGFDEILWP